MITYLAIASILLILLIRYNSSYYKGLYGSIFFLVLMPKNLWIQISPSFPAITIHRIVLLLMLAMWLKNSAINKKIENIPFIKLLFLISLTSAISCLNSTYFLVSIKQYIDFLFGSLVLYIIIITSIQKEGSFVPLIKTITASLAIVAILGIIERYTSFNPSELFVGPSFGYEFEKVQRLASASTVEVTYLHRILFGIPMAIGILYSIMLMGSTLDKPSPKKLIFSLCVFGAALYFSMSRGPWVAFILAALLLVIVDRKNIAKKILIFFILAIVAFVAKPGAYDTVNRLYNVSFMEESARGSNVQWRLQVLEMAVEKINHSGSIFKFLFGYSQGSHLFLTFPAVETTTGFVRAYESWDNEVAIILLEKGWIGVILICCLYYLIMKKGMSYYIQRDNRYRDVVLLVLGVQLIIILMKAAVSFYAPQLIYIEFINLAILGKLLSPPKKSNDGRTPLYRRPKHGYKL